MEKNEINLREMERVLVGVYGTLRKGHSNSSVMGDSRYLDTVKTPPKYTLYDGGFPIVEREGNTSIECEVYEVTNEEDINNICSLEGCTGIPGDERNWYDLEPFQLENGETVWFFVMNKGTSGRSRVVESGVWKR